TEAEWEYAAKAGSSTDYFWGHSEEGGSDYAVFNENSGSSSHNIASTKENAFELHDMTGNVWEWVNDWYGEYQTEGVTRNPKGAGEGIVKVIRGGSWQNNITELRSANRQIGNPGWNSNFVGFRTVLPL
ncbi:MAG: SUMF1/EgtB/PvdO family nonheme iron enzyme, partial [Flavobacteriales bacterium]|nr:SUMF1/EgtB/PvdO family nonheme iron enzyme [Flavobacteriales bacterium]